MPKLEIANNNRYGHRNTVEVPRWDRWDTRMPDVKDQLRAIDLYNKSGAVSKSDFVRARILGESFKVITVDRSVVEYHRISTAKRIAPFLKNEMRIFKEKRNAATM